MNDLSRTSFEQRAHNGMRLGIITLTNLSQGTVKQVSDRYSLADVQITEGIQMDPPRFT
jgi:hypothetical protein